MTAGTLFPKLQCYGTRAKERLALDKYLPQTKQWNFLIVIKNRKKTTVSDAMMKRLFLIVNGNYIDIPGIIIGVKSIYVKLECGQMAADLA